MPFHRFLQEFQGCLPITRLGDDAFQHLAFMIDSAPREVRDTIELEVGLIDVRCP
jgi:hypothetical protein